MGRELVAIFMDFENIRRGLWKYFQKRISADISIKELLEAVRGVASEIGTLHEAYVYGDWTVRGEDASGVGCQ